MSIHLNREDQRVLVAALGNFKYQFKQIALEGEAAELHVILTEPADVERAERLARLIGSIELPEVA